MSARVIWSYGRNSAVPSAFSQPVEMPSAASHRIAL